MRIFIGISALSIKQELNQICQQVKPYLTKEKMTLSDNFHITLLFIGEMDDIEDLYEHVSKIDHYTFEVILNHIDYFDKGNQKVIYLSLVPHEGLFALHKAILSHTKLAHLFNKSYIPHLTLFRKATLLEGFESIPIKPVHLKVDAFHIYESINIDQTLHYRILKTIHLK